MAMQAPAGFSEARTGDAVLFRIRPARAPVAFLAAAVLMAGMFGLPALAVLATPARQDPVSLGAALCALIITAGAVLAIRRARQGRAEREIRADAAGLSWPEGCAPWAAIAGLRVEQPAPPRGAAAGIHALAAGIAAQQQAVEARLMLDRSDGAAPAILASALDAAAAEALRQALLRHRPPRQAPDRTVF